ncbi:MAG: hypothetical protein M1834_004821 [Cirrosporium novae-zelandiae]|nr:MAG: hypothetical protein M1834_004821 [Cirrosporium novae-zelandiae]
MENISNLPVELPAKVSECSELRLNEMNLFDKLIGEFFDAIAERNPKHREWYRKISRSPQGAHQIAWKSGKPFSPHFLFFRTVDTARLMPMAYAEFRVQFWAHKFFWVERDAKKQGNVEQYDSVGFMRLTMVALAPELLLLRNRYDRGCGDIPIILTEWTSHKLNLAMEYWQALSRDEWSIEEKREQFVKVYKHFGRKAKPSFLQVDCLVRSLFLDPVIDYLPAFVIIMHNPRAEDGHARVLFQRPSFVPPPELVKEWPTGCGNPGCTKPDCSFIDIKETFCLQEGSPMETCDKMATVNGTTHPQLSSRLYSISKPPSIVEFEALCSQTTSKDTYPLAELISSNVPIYDLTSLHSVLSSPEKSSVLQDEWHHILKSGPGVLVLKHMYPDTFILGKANTVFRSIIASEKSSMKGDHFAAGGKNDRIWNSFNKHAMADPEGFVEYYSNPWMALVSEAWLGPAYQITAQVNVVKPGGAPQVSHRDYHLGFQDAKACARFPKAMHVASQLLTLQGAVAHSDMPLDSGPTRLLPFSQQFEEGFMAYRLPEFKEYFLNHWVALPLEMGDGVFFNPALFHAAGENRTNEVERSANLIQVSSAFGKTMETVEHLPLIEKCWDELHRKWEHEKMSQEVEAFIAAIGEGYPFPTNLDRRHPSPGGMAPMSQQDVLRKALEQGWGREQVIDTLKHMEDDNRVYPVKVLKE